MQFYTGQHRFWCGIDLRAREKIPFILGHALYMRAIHGGTSKNDKIDALKIASLLRGGMIPQAYVYPAQMEATRKQPTRTAAQGRSFRLSTGGLISVMRCSTPPGYPRCSSNSAWSFAPIPRLTA